jgi:hypothetical protein
VTDGRSISHHTAFCARCKAKRSVTLIRGYNGVRDHLKCTECGRLWPIGRRVASQALPPEVLQRSYREFLFGPFGEKTADEERDDI